MLFFNKLNQNKNSNSVKKIMIELDDFRNNGKKKNLRGHFQNYQMNYLTAFDLYINILLIICSMQRFTIFLVLRLM